MKDIFAPQAATDFTWQTWSTLRGRKMHVYAYRVAAAKPDSTWWCRINRRICLLPITV
jgi:hypothetical protein